MTRFAPLAIALAVFGALFAAIVISVMPHIGHFNYALDDAYIHLSVARNLAETGWFGVRPGEFVLLSSSPLFTTLLALLMKLFGPSEFFPLALASIGAVLALFVMNEWLRECAIERTPRAIALVLLGTGAMIVPLVTLGLEHTLHLTLTLTFVSALGHAVTSPSPRSTIRLILAAFPLVVLRYESLFLIASAALILAWQKKFFVAIGVAIASIAPAAMLGAYSVARGGTALPSSVLVKGGIPAGAGIAWMLRAPFVHFAANVKEAPHVLGMIATVAVLLALRRRAHLSLLAPAPLAGFAALGSMLFFMISSFASGFYRYELWLVWLAGAAAVPMFLEAWRLTAKERRHWLVCIWFPAAIAFVRALSWTRADPIAIRNIHDQQMVFGLFLARFHAREPVVVNDIGYISWAASPNMVDFAGLATPRITRAWRRGDFSMEMYDGAARAENARIAILFPNWYPRLPERFTPVASFTIPDNVCHNNTFVLYGLDAPMTETAHARGARISVEAPVEKKILTR